MRKSVVALLQIYLIVSAEAINFEKAPAIIWTKSDTYISPTITNFNLSIKFVSPCQVLTQYVSAASEDIALALQQCNQVFQEQITNQLRNLQVSFGSSEIIPKRNPAQAAVPKLQQQQQQQAIFVPQATQPVQNQIPIGMPSQIMVPRSIMDFVTGAFASNVIDTVLDHWLPNPQVSELQNRMNRVDQHLQYLNQQANFTRLELRSMADAMEINAKLVDHNIEKINTYVYRFPALTVVSANMIAKLHLMGSHLTRTIMSFRARRPDLITLGMLFNTDKLLEVDLTR